MLPLVVPNVTAHPPTASVSITVLLYNGPLLFGFDVPIKGLRKEKIGTLSYKMIKEAARGDDGTIRSLQRYLSVCVRSDKKHKKTGRAYTTTPEKLKISAQNFALTSK